MIRRNSDLADPRTAAHAAKLRYVSDARAGITRRRFGKGFAYYDKRGKRIEDEEVIARLQALAIPPAYREVWICPDPQGHLQATGRDDRGRKQYRYHPRFAEIRDEAKFARLPLFARTLPALRRRVTRHLKQPGLPRQKVLAACVRLLDETPIRIGNADYARDNGSFGLTTLRDRHAEFPGNGVVRFEFTGKHGIDRELEVRDGRLARIVQQCQDLPGQELMQYLDEEGNVCDVGSTDVNDYLRENAGPEVTAKDFRTWHGTVLAAVELRHEEPAEKKTPRNRQVVAAIDAVAVCLGNTRAVCRRCYVHPAVIEAFEEGKLAGLMGSATRVQGLTAAEWRTLAVLEA